MKPALPDCGSLHRPQKIGKLHDHKGTHTEAGKVGGNHGKIDLLSHRPNLAPSPGEKLNFGKLLNPSNITERNYGEVSELAEFESWFQEERIDLEDAEHWFEVNVLGCGLDDIGGDNLTILDVEIISRIRKLTPNDVILPQWIDLFQKPEGNHIRYTEADGVLYGKGQILVPVDAALQMEILRSRHNSTTAGHPGRSFTLALVQRSFMWRG